MSARNLCSIPRCRRRRLLLRTSAPQFYRLLDQTNYRKSVDSLLALLHALDCEVEVVVDAKSA